MFNIHKYFSYIKDPDYKNLFKDHKVFIVLKIKLYTFCDKSFMLNEFILLIAVFSVALFYTTLTSYMINKIAECY